MRGKKIFLAGCEDEAVVVGSSKEVPEPQPSVLFCDPVPRQSSSVAVVAAVELMQFEE